MGELIYFSKKPIIEFGKVEVGSEKTRELVVSNVNDYDANVVVEKVPEKKGFRVLCKEFSVLSQEKHLLPITWKPDKCGHIRESMLFKFKGYRCYVTVIGEAYEKPKNCQEEKKVQPKLSFW